MNGSLIEMPAPLVVAVDGTPAGQSALALAGTIAGQLGAAVTILCTIDAAFAVETHRGVISPANRTEYPAPARERLTAERVVHDALEDLRMRGLDAQGDILAGNPAQEIVLAAKRLGAGMIVMGHRHLSWFDRMLHPSVCWEVLEHSDCPVLVTAAEEKSESS